MSQSNFPRNQSKTGKPVKANSQGKPGQSKPTPAARTNSGKPTGQAAGSSLTKQEKELLEECLDELYDDYGTYRKSLKPGEEMNVTYQMFLSIVQKLGLRHPK